MRMFATRPNLRYAEIRAELRSRPATLAARLSELVDAGILVRTVLPEGPPRVEYTITDKGRDLLRGILAFDSFVGRHGPLGRERTKRREPAPARALRF